MSTHRLIAYGNTTMAYGTNKNIGSVPCKKGAMQVQLKTSTFRHHTMRYMGYVYKPDLGFTGQYHS